jgi:hypothetical protein
MSTLTQAVITSYKNDHLQMIFPDLAENIPVYRFSSASNRLKNGLLPFRWDSFQYLAGKYTKILMAGPLTANDHLVQGNNYLLHELACLLLKKAASEFGNELHLVMPDDNHFSEPADFTAAPVKHTVTSVQKFQLNEDHLKNREPSTLYFDWVNRSFRGVVNIKSQDQRHLFLAKGCPKPLLILEENQPGSVPGVQEFVIRGGILNKERSASSPDGRFIFLSGEDEDGPWLYTALLHFKPALPWLVYKCTQGPFHKLVMQQFGKSL